jgi:hypothetical protein
VEPGEKIVYTVTVEVLFDTVQGCLRQIFTSPFLEFVSIKPDGDFRDWGSAEVVWQQHDGSIDPGTLRGRVTMRVRADAPTGAVIEANGGPTIQHIVGAKKS